MVNTLVDPGWPHFSRYTFSPAVISGGFLFTSGMTASDNGRGVLCPGDIVGQADIIFARIGEILSHTGLDFSDLVGTREYIVDSTGYAGTAAVRRKYLREPFPVATGVVVAGLLRPGALIEIEAVAKLRQ